MGDWRASDGLVIPAGGVLSLVEGGGAMDDTERSDLTKSAPGDGGTTGL